MIYLDANASEPLRPEARVALLAALDLPGNPASIHKAGREARKIVETARENIAALVNADPATVIFCGGGTEANFMALLGLGGGRKCLIGATEHDAVRASAPDAVVLPVLVSGALDLAALQTALKTHPGALVAVMLANNETGILHPISEIAALCRKFGAWLHVDAVQGFGRLPIDVAALGATSYAISAHKFGGPKGVGALILAGKAGFTPPMRGGGQERGRRGGTPSIANIAGFAAAGIAAAAARDETGAHHLALTTRIAETALEAGAVLCGSGEKLANTLCLALPGVSAEAQLIALDMAGICVSSGSACSAGKAGHSHVLSAMGLKHLAGNAIRVSLPWNVTAADVEVFITAYRALALRALNLSA
jgi:cysteine desulfurase